MSLSKSQRAKCWNVEFFNISVRFGGVYQRDEVLSVADIAHDLNVCFRCDPPGNDAASWAPALLLKTSSAQSLIILDQHNDTPFPTPVSDIHCYEYVFHALDCASPRAAHNIDGMQYLLVSIYITANSIQIPVSF